MTDLITRIESADGPDRELDLLVHEARGLCAHRKLRREECDNDGYDLVCSTCGTDSTFVDQFYTASIDAALMLVPEEMATEVLLDAINANQETENWLYHLPRYICIAALKARGV